RRVSRGTVLVAEGDPLDTLYFVLEGVFTVAEGPSPPLRRGVGDVLGWLFVLDERSSPETVTALEDAAVLAFDRAELVAALDRDPSFAARFYRAVALRLNALLRRERIERAARASTELGQDQLSRALMDRLRELKAHLREAERHAPVGA